MKTDPEPQPDPETETEAAEAAGAALVELILAEAPPPLPARVDGVLIGKLVAFGAQGEQMVSLPGAPAPRPARAAAVLGPADVGREVACLFEGGDPARPIIMGLMHEPAPPAVCEGEAPKEASTTLRQTNVDVDGKRVTFNAEEEIVLQCGEASITLTRAGKILIRGAYVLTRSSGVNRILGGSVQIN